MICAIVLAAGQSRRMGAQKLLLPFAGQTVIGHVVDQVLQSRAGPVFVVVAQQGGAIAEALTLKPIVVVPNPGAEGDMLSSVRAGLRALPADCEAVVVVLGDQPLVSSQVIRQVIEVNENAGKIVVPTCDGQRGHPLFFSRDYFGEVLTCYDGIGLRGLVQAHPDEVREVNVDSPSVLEDMNYPDDYQRALSKFREATER